MNAPRVLVLFPAIATKWITKSKGFGKPEAGGF